MANNKSSGNDGFTKEFYVSFWGELGSFLVRTLNFCHEMDELTSSQRQAVISLIEKKDKDKRYIKNWRPISLLNVDLKIASKALTARIKKVIGSVILYDQTAYVKGRYIGESIRLIQDIIEYADEMDEEGILFSSDIEKAFDSVYHTFIFTTLKKFGFGPDFIQWVKTLLNRPESCVMKNGKSTGYFGLERGTRQGDPLSPYIFILVMEILFIQIRDDNEINGFEIKDFHIKLSAYADDAYFFLRNVGSLSRIFQLFENFEEFSSLRINLGKCEACWIGAVKRCLEKPFKCKWVSLKTDSIKVLGNHISYNTTLAHKLNFLESLSAMKSLLNIWKERSLTLSGKIQVFKSQILSKILYLVTMNSVPKTVTDELQTLHKDFIWNGRKAKIKHSTLIGDFRDGGMRDVDIPSCFETAKVSWIRRFFDDNFHLWKIVAEEFLEGIGGKMLFHPNLKLSKTMFAKVKQLPKFYRDLVFLWDKHSSVLCNQTFNSKTDILEEQIFNNRHLVIKNESFFHEHFYNAGIQKLDNFTKSRGELNLGES